MSSEVISLTDLCKSYVMGDVVVHALRSINLSIYKGEFVSIMGPSGSGKSTMMNILGCLDQPTSGSYRLLGNETSDMTDDELADVRNRLIGFVFQSFNLLARQTVLENVELPMIYAGVSPDERKDRAYAALESVGLAERVYHKPKEISGGQQQRVAIARALVNDPAIIMADEPTGNLDTKSGEEIMAIFQELNDKGITIVLVTHEELIAEHTRRIIRFRDGRLISDEKVAAPVRASHLMEKIKREEVDAG